MLVITSARVVARPASAAVRTSGGRLRSRASVAPARQILGLSRVRSVGGGPALSRRRVVGAALADEDDELDEGFGDIDRLAADDEAKSAADSDLSDPSVEQRLMNIGVNEVAEFGLSGRPLYVCQTMWWLRLSQLKTYAPDAGEVRDMARRSGLAERTVHKWFADALDHYHGLSLADKARYAADCDAKLKKLEALTVKLGDDDPLVFRGRDDDPVFMDAPWNEDGVLTPEEQEALTLEDPLYQTMTSLPGVMAAEAAAAQVEKDTEEGLDDDAVARIPQDGSAEKPFLVNPYTGREAGHWFVEKPVGPPNEYETSTRWVEGGGWDALPDHEIVSAVDGGALKYVGVNNDEHVPRDLWKLDRPAARDSLEMAEAVSTDGIPRSALRHVSDASRTQLQHLRVGAVLEGEVVACELYHGALVDVGCETDALIPVCEAEWGGVRAALAVGAKVKVRVAAIRPKWWRFRFPIELEVLEPDVASLIPTHPHGEGPPINIYSGESVPFAHWDADRPLDRFVRLADEDQEQELARRREEISAWVDEKLAEDDGKVKKSTRDRMQRVLAQAEAAAEAKAKEGALVAPTDEYDDDGPADGGAADALAMPDSSLRTMASQREEMIAAEEEEEEALFGDEPQSPDAAMGSMARGREDPDAVEEGDGDDDTVDTSADDNFAMNLNPEAEDMRGGMLKGVDDIQAKPEDFDDDDEGEDDDDELGVSGAR